MSVATDCDTEFTQKLRSLIRRRNTLLAAVAVPGLVLSFIFAQLFWLPMIGSILICIFIAAFFAPKKKKLIGCVHEIEENMLANAFEMITHKPDAHINEAQLREVQLRLWNRCRGSNLIRARYKGADFTYSDVYLWHYAGRLSSIIFHGQWLILHLNKKIDSPLIVSDLLIPGNREKKRGCVKVREGFFGVANQIPIVQTGNEAFDKQFAVLTEDPQMVSQLLTPTLMESILAARTLAGAQMHPAKMHLCFTEDRLHIAIYSEENFFRPYDGLSNDIPALRKRLRWEIDFLTRIMDEFVSNEELFKHM